MFQAFIYQDSPCLAKMRGLLSKQCLQWDEEVAPLAKLTVVWNGTRNEHVIEDKPAVKITVANTSHKVKATRAKPIKRAAKPVDLYKSREVSQGVFVWSTPKGEFKASFAYDAKAQERIKKETQARIDKALQVKTGYHWKGEPHA